MTTHPRTLRRGGRHPSFAPQLPQNFIPGTSGVPQAHAAGFAGLGVPQFGQNLKLPIGVLHLSHASPPSSAAGGCPAGTVCTGGAGGIGGAACPGTW